MVGVAETNPVQSIYWPKTEENLVPAARKREAAGNRLRKQEAGNLEKQEAGNSQQEVWVLSQNFCG